MLNQKGIALPGIILIVLLLVGGGLGAVWNLSQNKLPVGTPQDVTKQPTASSSVDTANGQTYTNKQYNYSIQYPSNIELTAERFHFIGDNNRKDTADGFGPNLAVYYRGVSTVEDAVKAELTGVKMEPAEINNAKGVKVGDFDYYLRNKNNTGAVIRILFNPQDYSHDVSKEKIQEMRSIAEKMLQTFKFTDPETADWKTYTNSQKGFLIKYPQKLVRLICPGEDLNLEIKNASNEKSDEQQLETCARDGRFDIEVQVSDKLQEAPTTDKFYDVISDSTKIAGISAERYTITPASTCEGICSPQWQQEIRLNSNGKTYVFYLWKKDLLSDFEQMLTTFKFTN